MSQITTMKYAEGDSQNALYTGIPLDMHSVIVKGVRAVVSVVSSIASACTINLYKGSTKIGAIALGASSAASEGMIKNATMVTSSNAHLTEFTDSSALKVYPDKAVGAGVNVELIIEWDFKYPKS